MTENPSNAKYISPKEDSDDFIAKYTKEKYDESRKNSVMKEYENESSLISDAEKSNINLLIHFYSNEFPKCVRLNDVLTKVILRKNYPEITLARVNVNKCPKIVGELQIRCLPFIGTFKNGFFIESMNGYEKFGNGEDVTVEDVERYLEKSELNKVWEDTA